MEILKRIDPEEMEKIKQLENRARSLHLPLQGLATFSIELFDKNGNPKALYEDRSRSWVRNKYNLLVNQMLGVGGTLSPWDTYGSGGLAYRNTRGILGKYMHHSKDLTLYPHYSSSGVTNYGIQIGISDTAESFEDDLIGSLIAHGSGAGQMEYGDTAKITTWESGDSRFKCSLARNIVNNSGNTIGVKEIALVGAYYYNANVSLLLQARDVLASTVNVANEEQIRVTYNLYGPAYP